MAFSCNGSGVRAARVPSLRTTAVQQSIYVPRRGGNRRVPRRPRISDCYASSYLKAVPGSPHGYDVADPTRLNPDIGTDADYWKWIDALPRAG